MGVLLNYNNKSNRFFYELISGIVFKIYFIKAWINSSFSVSVGAGVHFNFDCQAQWDFFVGQPPTKENLPVKTEKSQNQGSAALDFFSEPEVTEVKMKKFWTHNHNKNILKGRKIYI